MNSDQYDLDLELKNWLASDEDGVALGEVAGRLGRFAADKQAAPGFTFRVQSQAFATRPSWRRQKLLRGAIAAGLLLAGAGIGFHLSQPPAKSEMAWGDVVQAMDKVDRFHALVFSDNPNGPAGTPAMFRMDIYYQHPDQWRAQGMNYIQFGVAGEAKFYGINQQEFVQPGLPVPRLIPDDFAENLKQRTLLDAVVRALFVADRPPNAKIVKDPAFNQAGVEVFDYRDETAGAEARVWVLEQSRLPIRVQASEPGRGCVTLATFDYSESQPAGFFDVEAFKRGVAAAGPPTTQEAYRNEFPVADVAGWYKLAAQWQQPATDLKYSENPADVLAGNPLGREYAFGDRKIRTGAFNTGPVDRVPLYNAKGKPVLADYPMVFIHERTSTTGLRRVVGVSEPTFAGTNLVFQFWEMTAKGSTFETVRSGTAGVDMAGICGPGEIRLFAGQTDPADGSKFSIPYECKSGKGWIDGVFEEDYVSCSVRRAQ